MIQAVRILAVILAAVIAAPCLVGAEGGQSFLGSTVGGPLFNRPSTDCFATTTSVRYQAQRFRLRTPARCMIYSSQSYDGFIHLYRGSFDPANPTANCLIGNSNDGQASGLGAGTSVLRTLDLVPNTAYTLVTSAFSNPPSNGSEGAFANTVHCGSEPHSPPVVLTVQPRHGSCLVTFAGIPADQQICLGDRFFVAIDQITNSPSGFGTPVRAGSSDTGLFWFYDDRTWEVMVKVLNGCSINNRFWVFGGALTNQGYRLRVADDRTLEIRTYTNTLGTRAPALTDVQAFPCN